MPSHYHRERSDQSIGKKLFSNNCTNQRESEKHLNQKTKFCPHSANFILPITLFVLALFLLSLPTASSAATLLRLGSPNYEGTPYPSDGFEVVDAEYSPEWEKRSGGSVNFSPSWGKRNKAFVRIYPAIMEKRSGGSVNFSPGWGKRRGGSVKLSP